VLHMPQQMLVVYPPITLLSNEPLATLNGLRLLASAALLGDIANAPDVSPAKAFGMLVEAPRVEALGEASRRRGFSAVSVVCEEEIDRGCARIQ
jgi:hypothetical protein